jgi:hypothetical protein
MVDGVVFALNPQPFGVSCLTDKGSRVVPSGLMVDGCVSARHPKPFGDSCLTDED